MSNVPESVNFLRTMVNNGLVSGVKGTLKSGSIVVPDLPSALRYSGRDNSIVVASTFPFCDWYPLRTTARSEATEEMQGRDGMDHFREYRDALRPLQDRTCDDLAERGLPDTAEEAHTDVYLMGAYLITGNIPAIGAALLEAYAAGGWPCGWSGDFPDGHLIVYWPYDQAPEFR